MEKSTRVSVAGEGGRSVLEALLVFALVALLLLAAIDRYRFAERRLKETALTIELSNLRSGVTYYTMIKRRLPPSLKILVTESIEIPSKGFSGEYRILVSGKFVEAASLDKDGNPLDPFGATYGYDPSTGRVWSTTAGYERW